MGSSKIASAGNKIKKAGLPTAGELKEKYLNSAFHKSLNQPLMVKVRTEKPEVREARQALTEEKNPSQLANIESVGDFPIPNVFGSGAEDEEETEAKELMTMPKNMEEWQQAAYNTIPRSLREQNIVTAIQENLDPEELARNQELTRSKTPAELSQITSLSEFPVPDNIKSFLTWRKKEEAEKKKVQKLQEEESEPEEPAGPPEPFSLYATLPRSLRETKLVTVVKEEDQEVVQANQELVQTHTPAQLAAITCLADIPIPTKLTRLMESRDHSAHNGTNGAVVHDGKKIENGDVKSPSKLNLNDMYATLPKSLPKSLTMDLAVSSVVEDQNMVEQNRKLTQEKSVLELSKIGSISDLPIPTPISNLFNKTPGESKTPGEVAADDTPTRPKRRNMEEKRKRNLTTGTFLSADFVPPSWIETKIECSRIVEDPDVVKARQELVSGKSVSELGQIHGLDDFPVPDKIQSLLRKKRVLKTTEEKESLRAGIARSLTSLSTKSITSLGMPESLKCQLAVKSVVEDQELVAKNKETVKTKSVGELSAIGALSEIPIPDNIENIYKTITEKLQRTEDKEAPPERPSTPQSYKEKIYDTLPRSLREQQLLCATKLEEDQERVHERQELTRTKSPTQLSQISSISDFPVPKPIEQLLQKKSEQEESDSPVPPPRKWRQEDIYDSIPASLKSELLVSHTTSLDPEEAAAKMEFVRTHTPAELGQIHSLSDIPIPDIIENLLAKKETTEPTEKEEVKDEEKEEKGPFKIYDIIPASLTETKLECAVVEEDPEVQAARAEIVKSKS